MNAVCSRTQLRELDKLTPRQFKGLFMEYMIEAEHGSWEGFTGRDRTGIRRFVADLILYSRYSTLDGNEVFTGSETFNRVEEKEEK